MKNTYNNALSYLENLINIDIDFTKDVKNIATAMHSYTSKVTSPKVTSLTEFEARATGRTTRVVDQAIQTLYTDNEVTLVDHYYHTTSVNRKLSEDIANRVVTRLEGEHKLIKNVDFTINWVTNLLEITFTKTYINKLRLRKESFKEFK